ncbi:MAG: [FeFe] hydrogenase H-cluster maturation GTPase HydF [Firmicutes bacterium HGW-Firmicutes-15]|nr:MAG: [FeFe] hydrogenase H-cluster maturation GTPase HydF [Firmicutes bacterium HGW-Firmicutes-15]
MSLNNTPSSDRVHIAFFGKRNAGKSSVVNAVTGQNIAIVSDVKGTTTDPVYKAMELLPLGPVMIIDTPGIDDEGELGSLRVRRSLQVLNKTDVAVLVIDGTVGKTNTDDELIDSFKRKNINYIIAYNKSDLRSDTQVVAEHEIWVSAKTLFHIHELKERIAKLSVSEESKLRIVADLIEPSDFVVLVVPIDKAAPKGRLILPQQQTIRDILEADATAIVVKEYELRQTLDSLGKKPKLVITDSQVFAKVSADTPRDILLTSFSILFARYKGNLELAVKGAKAIDYLDDGDAVLISEGCTHHRQCDDIGTVKVPRWIKQHTGKQLNFEFSSGTEFPVDLSKYKLIVHCGGCMLNEREMKYRQQCAQDQNIPITNYGILIAYMQGILKRSIEPFPYIAMSLED